MSNSCDPIDCSPTDSVHETTEKRKQLLKTRKCIPIARCEDVVSFVFLSFSVSFCVSVS